MESIGTPYGQDGSMPQEAVAHEAVPRWRQLFDRRGRSHRSPEPEYETVPHVMPQSGPPIFGTPPRPVSAVPASVIESLRRDLGRCRVVAFANPKGGVHKTTATVLAAATLGSARGRGVVAWDNNELRGTLGLRAGTARHARTIRHLVNDLIPVEASGPQIRELIDDYLRHSTDGSFDVLAGDEDPKLAGKLDPHTVLRVLDVLTRTHDIICIDTGNNVESPNWRTVIEAADQLVITTVPREDAAFAADWMMDLLIENGHKDLVANAVTILSCPTPNPGALLTDLQGHFATRTRRVAVVPYDPALEAGSSIEYSVLQQGTRDAWAAAAHAIVERIG